EVGQRFPGRALWVGTEEVGRLPNTAGGAADENGIARGVGRIDGNPRDARHVVAAIGRSGTHWYPGVARHRVSAVKGKDAAAPGALVDAGLTEARLRDRLEQVERPVVDPGDLGVGVVLDLQPPPAPRHLLAH